MFALTFLLNFRRSLKLLTWNDNELTPKGPQRLRYEASEDGCQVRHYYDFLFCLKSNFSIHSQDRSDEWSQTTISYTTDKAARLPIVDIAVRDVGEANQQFWVELGPVCYT